ncbi:membrane or secreted protein [uncultured Pontibacter sp.]|uniref:membrane or secreted protein n=1 Tax=uncultured Pontibacter sp. TaxID=453356 RepID=UPI0026081A76|nr:membrane or secreted protein [uncultured Pontibacter sp.]
MHLIHTYTIVMMAAILNGLSPELTLKLADKKLVTQHQQQTELLKGSWQLTTGAARFTQLPAGATAVATLEDGYFTVAYFDKSNKEFLGTYGGTYTLGDNTLTQHYEYNTLDTALVGTTDKLNYTLQKGQLQLKNSKVQQTWDKVDETAAASPLQGTWRITGRAGQNSEINQMRRGPRKTLKILSGNRFQWIAFNTDTKEFSGTGGGTYTAENGKYTETIEFFSRNSSRVGARLEFNFEVEDGKWLHTGQSSTGKEINEVWEREH